jgi:DNA mismatch repair protein MutS2
MATSPESERRDAGDDVLELGAVLDDVASFAASGPGREACRALGPSYDEEPVREEIARVADYIAITAEERPPLGELPDVRPHASAARTPGAHLGGAELKEVAAVITAVRQMRGFLRARAAGIPRLLAYLGELHSLPDLDRLLADSLDEEGGLRDDASPALRSIRRELRVLRAEIEARLARLFRQSTTAKLVADEYVTVRNGRFVVPLKAASASELPGIVQDRSASGETLFVEPLFAVESNNRLLIAAREEAQEEARILGELTAAVGASADALEEAFRALVALDTLGARARFARVRGAVCPEIGGEEVRLRNARHPLLVQTGRAVVPIDIELDAATRLLLITGPNTGGKSVALKTLGLSSLLAQAGVPVLADPGARLPLFDAVWTDIGDQQTVAGDLSTFSGHMRNLAAILAGATARSLVLLDEPGTGTDPEDGAALARVLLQELVQRGARVLATTHFPSVKTFALALSNAAVAAVDFDPDTFSPRYRLVRGSVGPSLGLTMARRLGFPGGLVDTAERERSRLGADLAVALERLEAERRRHEDLAERAIAERQDLVVARHEHEKLAGELRAKRDRRWAEELGEAKRFADELKREGRRLLADARRRPRELARDLIALGGEQSAAISARERDVAGGDRPATAREPARVGDEVQVEGSGLRGAVVQISGDRAQIARGAIRFDVPLAQLTRVASGGGTAASAKPRRERVRELPPADRGEPAPVSKEINLIGDRVASALARLDSELDRAMLDSHAAVRIIHGHGTGALRGAVREHLARSPYVHRFEEADPAHGGDGATIAYLR